MSKPSKDVIEELRNLVAVQGLKGNWDTDSYMQGMYNGMELMLATVEGREPKFRSLPKTKPKPPATDTQASELDEIRDFVFMRLAKTQVRNNNVLEQAESDRIHADTDEIVAAIESLLQEARKGASRFERLKVAAEIHLEFLKEVKASDEPTLSAMGASRYIQWTEAQLRKQSKKEG